MIKDLNSHPTAAHHALAKPELLPLTAAQRDIWFALGVTQDNACFNIADYREIHAAIDPARMVAAIKDIVHETDTLRLKLCDLPEGPKQWIAPAPEQVVQFFDVRHEAAPLAAALHWMHSDVRQGTDVFNQPLFAFALFQLAADHFIWYQRYHHLIMDGVSGALIAKRLAQHYEQQTGQQTFTPQLEGLWVSDQHYRVSGKFASDRDYWLRQLEGRPDPTTLSGRAPTHGGKVIRGSSSVPADWVGAIALRANQGGASLADFFNTAAAVFLHCMTGNEDLLFGVAVAARVGRDLRRIPGMASNVVPLRLSVTAADTVTGLLARTVQLAREGLRRQRYRQGDLRRDLGLHPVNDFLFAAQVNFMPFADDLQFGAKPWAAHNLSTGPVDDLAINIYEQGPGQAFRIDFDGNADLYTDEELKQHQFRFLGLLRTLVDHQTAIGGINLVSSEERHRLLIDWNQTARSIPTTSLPQLFAAQVERVPHAAAIWFEGAATSYAELDLQSAQLAQLLRQRGVGAGSVVGIALERGPLLVVALMGVLRAGAAYLPLDPHHPANRIGTILSDANAELILCDHRSRSILPTAVAFLELDSATTRSDLAGLETLRTPFTANQHELAYLIYTSGSTGQPKGVAVTHGALTNFLLAMHDELGLKERDRWLAVTTISFDIAALELYLPLCCGAAIELAPREATLDGSALDNLSRRCSFMQATPSTWRMMLGAGWLPRPGFSILVGGEAVPGDLTEILLQQGAQVRNMYGPTETTIWSSCAVLSGPGGRPAVESIGSPISNTCLYVLDAQMRLRPPGMAGELFIAGDGLARGYVGRSGLTADRFIANPFGRPGARMYRTGDLVRHRADGNLEYLGRLDQQVKIRGFRVEIGEIEAVLAECEGVNAAVVQVLTSPPAEAQLVAYIVGPATAKALRAALKARLPDYMLPSAFVALERLPLTPNGKIDRRSLPAPVIDGTDDQHYRAPRNAREAALAAIAADVLKRERIGIDEDFFALGANSLHITRLIAQARLLFGMDIPISLGFSNPSVAALTESMNAAAVQHARRLLPIPPRPATLPLSYTQQAFWFHEQLRGGSSAYLMPFALELVGALDPKALQLALNDSLQRHEVLRTVFPLQEGRTSQQILPAPGSLVTIRSGTGFEWRDRLAELAAAPIDVTASPPLRLELFAMVDHHHVLLVVIHHIAFDGTSARLWLDELAVLYAARLDNHAVAAPLPLAPQYADYALNQRRQEWSVGPAAGFWRETLNSAPPLLELPYDRPRLAVRQFRGAEISFTIAPALQAQMHQFALECQATPFMLLHATLALILARYSNSRDIVIGTPVANRVSYESEHMLGPLVNTIVLRTQVDDALTPRAWLAYCRRVALAAYAHQDMPFERLVDLLQVERTPSYNPVFQVMLVQEDELVARTDFAGHDLQVHTTPVTSAKFDLLVSVRDTDEGFRVRMEYDSDLFDPASVRQLALHWQQLARGVVEQPDCKLATLPLLSQTERWDVLEQRNQTTADRVVGETLTSLLEAAAQRHAASTALEFDGTTLSYAELHARANRLAHHLHGLGVGPDTLVGICLDRSIEMVVGLLAVLKAGGAYVPLDPGYPEQRLAFMIEDAAPRLILTETKLSSRLQGAPLLCIDTLNLDPMRSDALGVEIQPSNLAYVIFTSGSTGRPKGAMNSHAGIVNRLHWMQHAFGLTPDDRVLQKTPFGFDVSVWEFFWPLLQGARLVLALPDGHKDAAYLANLIRSSAITTAHFVPSMLQVFLQEPEAARCQGLWRVICSGEALSPELRNQFHATLSVPLHNLYGPTEAAVDVSHWPCGKADTGSVPIGRPVWNTRLYVLDPCFEPVPYGVAGELFIAGIQLGRGYLRRAGLTSEKFIADPHGTPGSRMYRTGDRARMRADGAIEYLGRLDDQIKLRGLRIELGEIESALLAFPGVATAVVVVCDQVLVAYFTEQAKQSVGVAALRAHLKCFLPDYMVPVAFERLDALPISPNGKLDRRALPAPTFARVEGGVVAPRNARESTLLQVWQALLGARSMGVEDNFFDLGGDSIMSIQMVARARQLGLQITPRQVFEYQTIASLAVIAGELANVEPVATEDTVGPLPLTPIQHWFLDQTGPMEYSYQSIVLALPPGLDLQRLQSALLALALRHPTLRLRFERDSHGWQQEYGPTQGFEFPLRVLPIDEPDTGHIQAACRQAAPELDPHNGKLVQAVLFRSDVRFPAKLLLLIHHLAVDGVSWRILMADLPALYEGQSLVRPDDGFAQHARRLVDGSRNPALAGELAHWVRAMATPVALHADHTTTQPNTIANSLATRVQLSVEDTQALLGPTCAAYHTRINDVLLTAMAMAVARHRVKRGFQAGALGIDLEGHGRDEQLDLSHSVGWFTSLFPVALDLGEIELDQAFHGGAAAGIAVCRIKEQLRQVPGSGLGYGVLRYLHPDSAGELARLPQQELLFNYLGRIDQGHGMQWPLVWQPLFATDAPQRHRAHQLEFNAVVVAQQFEVNLRWNGARYDTSTITELADDYLHALRAIIAHCAQPAVGRHTPSDFPLAKLSESQLAGLALVYPAVEDIYPLAPLQHGMLFHRLFNPQSHAYHQQVCLRLRGDIAPQRMQQAWAAVLDRHPALRVAVAHADLPTPVQVVRADLEMPWYCVDADESHASVDDIDAQLNDWLVADRNRGFVLEHDVLVRAALFHGGASQYLAFSYHHLVLDGWSLPLLVGEVLQRYCADRLGQDPILVPVVPHAHLLRWLSQQDPVAAHDFWRARLAPIDQPTVLSLPTGNGPACGEIRMQVSAEDFKNMEQRARGLHVTINTVVQGAWALLLMRLTGRDSVVYGATVAGRPADLPGVETMLGMCINTLPVVANARSTQSVVDWLGVLQTEIAELQTFAQVPLAELQALSAIPPGMPLFDTIVVFENYPIDAALRSQSASVDFADLPLSIESVRVVDTTHFGVALIVTPSDGLSIRLSFDPARFDDATVTRLGQEWLAIVNTMMAEPERPVANWGQSQDKTVRVSPQAVVARRSGKTRGGQWQQGEEQVAAIFADVLGPRELTRDSHFFELGGHSLSAIQVVSRLRRVFNIELALRSVFDRPVVADLASYILNQQRSANTTIPRQDGQAVLSYAQSRLWFLDQLDTVGAAYHIPLLLRMDGELNVDALQLALERLLERHESLRTSFHNHDGQPVAQIKTAVTFPLRPEPFEGDDQQLKTQASLESQHPFDLSHDVPIRVRLLRRDARTHILMLTLHHIAADGWSADVLVGELATLYRGAVLEPLAIRYSDYAHWQNLWLDDEKRRTQTAYWRAQLAEMPHLINLPVDTMRPLVQSHRGHSVRFNLDAWSVRTLQGLAQGHDATLFMVLFAAFAALLSRHTGQLDIGIGTPLANRDREELEGLVGLFVNTVVLRTNMAGQPDVAQLLARVRHSTLDAFANRELPFEEVVEALSPERTLAHTPLVQAMFSLQSKPTVQHVLGTGLHMTRCEVETGSIVGDLVLNMWESDGGLEGLLQTNSDLFLPHYGLRLIDHFQRLLHGMVAAPQARVLGLDILGQVEKDALSDWNRTERAYAAEESLCAQFAQSVLSHGTCIAVEHDAGTLTYAELDAWSARLAEELRRAGVRPGQRVGLSGQRSPALIAGMLAILETGAAYVPLDPAYPSERLAFMAADCALQVTLVGPGGRAPQDLTVLDIGLPRPWSRTQPGVAVNGNAPAYVMYTSGSTGTPKGIVVPQHAVTRLVRQTDYVHLGVGDRIAHMASPSFDAATFEIWGALLNGGTIVILERDTVLAPAALTTALRTRCINTAFMTTALFNRIAQEIPHGLACLRDLAFGGEAVDPRQVRAVLQAGGPKRLLHVYGPTETTTFATWQVITSVDADAHTLPIGQPLANGSCHVLDAQMLQVPLGVAGELYIGGAGLAHGYLARPALTAERFVADPYGAPGTRLYRTGDLVRRRIDGSIDYLGRLDQQIKLRGFRIELGEIESVLAALPGVGMAAVVLREDQPGIKRLVAYASPLAGQQLVAEKLQADLRARLPEYMLPNALVLLPELALNANGKVNRAVLPVPHTQAHRTPPRSTTEAALAAIWQEVLGIDAVGIEDDFFALGGHSLLATKIVVRIRESLAIEVSLRQVFETPTLAAFAARLEESRIATPAPVPTIRKRNR